MDDGALLLRDFVNTLDVGREDDRLGTRDGLVAWLAGRGLAPAGATASAAELAAAVKLREGLRAAMLGHHEAEPGPPPPRLEEALAGLPVRISLATGRPAAVPLGHGVAGALGSIAAALVEAAADGTWQRLKVCQEETCRSAFLDTSRNRSRAWCSMALCGNRTKTRAYRARRRT
jgi:predicted RNA-binding Zn ribbon-like protein